MLLSRANLRTKVTLLLLSLSLGPLLISGIVNETRAVATGKAAVRERQAQAARFAAYTVNALFDDVLRDTQLLARRFPVDSLDPQAISARLSASPGLLPAVQGDDDLQVFNALHGAESRTFLALPDGRLVYAEPFHNIPQPPNLHQLQWFQQIGPNGGIALGDLTPLTQPARPSVFCIVPLRHPGGRLAGYVGHIVARSSLETIVKQLPAEPAWQSPERVGHALGLGLLSPQGIFAAHTAAELVGRPAPPYMQDHLHPGTGEIDRDGSDVLLARSDVGRGGWRVTLATPRHTAYQAVYALIWLLTAVIVLTFLFVLLFADHLATVLLRPIEELERGAQMIGAGALD
jgi:hypothetical protein